MLIKSSSCAITDIQHVGVTKQVKKQKLSFPWLLKLRFAQHTLRVL